MNCVCHLSFCGEFNRKSPDGKPQGMMKHGKMYLKRFFLVYLKRFSHVEDQRGQELCCEK